MVGAACATWRTRSLSHKRCDTVCNTQLRTGRRSTGTVRCGAVIATANSGSLGCKGCRTVVLTEGLHQYNVRTRAAGLRKGIEDDRAVLSNRVRRRGGRVASALAEHSAPHPSLELCLRRMYRAISAFAPLHRARLRIVQDTACRLPNFSPHLQRR